MLVLSDATKKFLSLKVKIILSLFAAASIDQFNFLHFIPLQPNFSFLTLYVWIFLFKSHLSFPLIFLFGIFVDLIGGSFLGENTLLFITLYGSMSFYQEHFSNNYAQEWPMLWTVVALATLFQLVLISIIHWQFVFSFYHILNNALIILFYPLIKLFVLWLVKERNPL